MTIVCYLFQGCGVEQILRENITQVLTAEKVQAEVAYYVIDDKKAISLNFQDPPQYLSMERKFSLKGQSVFLEECSAMSQKGSPTLLQLKQFGSRLENARLCNC